MKLYHGTSEKVGVKALTEGLKPRHMTGKGNWKHTVASRPDAIYLTSVYAPYFGMCATNEGRIAVIEVETEKLDQSKFNPDEDFLEQATRGHDEIKKSMEKRTAYYKKHAADYADKWKLSIKHLGTCCYVGAIPPEAITRVVFWDWKTNSIIAGAMLDPTITIANFKFCEDKYAALTRWIFGEKITVRDFYGYDVTDTLLSYQGGKEVEGMLEKWEAEIREPKPLS